ncbi:hypothetical protein JOC85_001941 [Bacillus mesophilus]|uniref:DUF3907 family protein n=1 Tax=Bacillus mesophilus TaxID=1808955 RepID=A0A6M0Q4Y3_9BACI|nr:YpuI family protein [Bacillus mesophilus]MBM7661169.1 hypothetical protein [Bacillus mesophilus]NEY71304.1 DUF3907 family protein [Bacillus mesophilus]
MGNDIVFSQIEQVETFLSDSVKLVSNYLNEATITTLKNEGSEEQEEYYKQLLSGLRRLVVFCEEGLDTCHIVLNTNPFRKPAAEKTLYKIYHQCIEEFFSPKNDVWYENSRSAYTGKNAIKFTNETPASIQTLFSKLEGPFQKIREELEYYETDYRTKMMQS